MLEVCRAQVHLTMVPPPQPSFPVYRLCTEGTIEEVRAGIRWGCAVIV